MAVPCGVPHRPRRSWLPSPAGDLLVVDDDPDVARALARFFARRGFRVATAQTPERAIALSAAGARAIIDIELGADSGIVLALSLLASQRVRRVVFFSGCSDVGHLARAAQLGEVVRKADGVDALLAALTRRPVSEARNSKSGRAEKAEPP